MKKILIQSFSSGIDSTTTIYKAIDSGIDIIIPINYTYGQKNIIETFNQKNLIKIIQDDLNKDSKKIKDVVKVNIEAMFQQGMNLYKELRDSKTIKERTGTEYYTPMRNTLFSTIAAMLGEIVALNETEEYEVLIGIGVHKHSDIYTKDYWDITPEFVNRLNKVFELNDSVKLSLYAPYKDKTKAELIEDALRLKVPYKETWTCYNPSIKEDVAIPCLECEACKERERAFQINNINDGNNYQVILDKIDNDISLKYFMKLYFEKTGIELSKKDIQRWMKLL